MDIKNRFRESLLSLLKALYRRRSIVLALSCAVVFVTTYLLILPAFTLEKDEALKQGGIDVPGVEQTADTDEVSADSAAGDADRADKSVAKDASKPATKEAEQAEAKDDAAKSTAKESGKASTNGKSAEVTLQNDESDGFVVAVEGKGAGLSEDMSVAVREIDQSDRKQKKEYKSLYDDALEAVQKAQKEEGLEAPSDFAFAKFYDISLMDGNTAVEPDSAVDVKISFSEDLQKELKVTDPDRVHIVHFAVDKETGEVTPEVLDAETTDVTVEDNKVTEAAFTADSFSVFAVVYTADFECSADGKTYKIKVAYDENSGIPDGAELDVEEIAEGSADYQNYLQQSAKELGLASKDISFARFFDIRIVDNGKEVEPKTPVQVEISYDDAVEMTEKESLNIVHFAEKGTEVISDVSLSTDGKDITYQQSSFSVTGTIVGEPSNGDQRMVLVKDGTRYYIVNNDASLTEVGYDEQAGEVSVTDPMLWTFEGSGNSRHIYFNSEATGFGTNLIASDYYRRYLDPSSDTAWLQEQSITSGQQDYVVVTKDGDFVNNGETVETNHVSNRNAPMNATTLTFSNGTISHNGQYFAIERDANGDPVRLVGGKSADDPNVAHFQYATASKVPSGLHLDNAVNHIDISIAGDAKVNVPLAYGDYYDKNGNVIKTVTDNTKLTLTEREVPDEHKDMLNITTDDMKRATISALDKNGNELDDAFYITGFSANTSTDVSTVQVRIEGRFLCADLRETQYEHIDSGRYDGWFDWSRYQYHWPDGNYVNAVRRERLQNIVEYNVTVVKPVTFNLVDPEVGQLYDADGNALTVTVDCAFSGNFNYWDYGKTAKNSGNECPPLQGNADWRAGDIPNHDMSGMDFVLTGDAEDENSPLVAIEITKVIRDEEGNTIKLETPVTNTFDVYQNKSADRNGVAGLNVDSYQGERDGIYDGYSLLHSRNIKVGEHGSALIYDYNVTDGMYYISEQKDTVPETVTDTSGKEYTYVKTYIETEYVRRGDAYDDNVAYPDPMHVSSDYTKESGDYRSIPEVAGHFNDLTGQRRKSGFLEFYVYNIYTTGKDVPVEKVWADGTDIPENAEVTAELWYRARRIKDAEGNSLDTSAEWSEYAKLVNDTDGFSGIQQTELTLKANSEDESKNWKGEFKNLPNTVTRNDGLYEVQYTVKESAVKVTVDNKIVNVAGDYEVTTEVKDGVILITNKRETTELNVEKKWMEDDSTAAAAPDGAEVTVELMFASRRIRNADGSVPASLPEWSDYKAVKAKEANKFDELFANDPLFDETGFVTELVLKADDVNDEKNWKGSFNNLPKTLTDSEGNTYEIDYSVKETAVNIPGEGKTYVDDEAVDVYDHYVVKEEKQDGDDSDGSADPGKVTVTNTKKKVITEAEKQWEPSTPENGEAVVQLKRYKKKAAEKPELTEAKVVKEWDDEEAPEGTRPENVRVSLYNGDTLIGTEVLNEANDWTATKQGLPKYEEGADETKTEIQYKWREDSNGLDDYSSSYEYSGNTTKITNKYTPSKRSFTVEKVWDDADDQDGIRPSSLSVSLVSEENNEAVKTVNLDKDNDWTAESGPVLVRDGDTEISYKWVEGEAPDGYELISTQSTGDVTTLTNKHIPETTEAEISLFWNDKTVENRPESVTATLSNGTEVVLNESNNWTAKVENLPKKYSGKDITYTWSAPDIAGYETPTSAVSGTKTTVTYSAEPEKDTVRITINTVLASTLPEGWSVNIYNVMVNGERIDEQLGNMYMTSYSLRPISFEVPRNSKITYYYSVSGDIKLNGITSPVGLKYFGLTDNGSRTVSLKAGAQDIDIYMSLSDKNTPDLVEPDPPEPPAPMNLTVRLVYLEGNKSSNTFGWNKPEGTAQVSYSHEPWSGSYSYTLTQTELNTWTASNIEVVDMDDEELKYKLSGGFWNLNPDDMLVITSSADGFTGTKSFTETGGKFDNYLTAQSGDVELVFTIGPKSVLQARSVQSDAPSQVKMSDAMPLRKKLSISRMAATVPALKASTNSSVSMPEDYEEDTGFDTPPVTLTLNSTKGWKQSFPAQDKYDENGNEYIYYVVENSHTPENYQTASITGNPNNGETVVITNAKEPETCGLTITKEVKVNNGAVPSSVPAIADGTYTFTIAGPNDYSATKSITVTNGVAEGSIELTGLRAGTYTVTETGSTNPNGINLDSAKTINVAEGSKAADNVVAFTNNLETTQLNVSKSWDETSPDNHPQNVLFKVYRAGYYIEDDEEKPASQGYYPDDNTTYTISGSETTTVSNLPVRGTESIDGVDREVSYTYRVTELPVEGDVVYWPTYSQSGENITIINTPVEPPAHETEISVSKSWLDKSGQPADEKHANDKIEFTMEQIPHSTGYVPVTVRYINRDNSIWKTQELFVKKGGQITFTFTKGRTLFSHMIDLKIGSTETSVGGRGEQYAYTTSAINEAVHIEAKLTYPILMPTRGDQWGDTVEDLTTAFQWTSDVAATGGTLYTDYQSFYSAMAVDSNAGEANESIYELGKTSLTKISGTADGTVTGDWSAEFTHLPEFQKVGEDYVIYTYKISELKVKPNGKAEESVGSTTSEGYQGETTNYLVNWANDGSAWTITNREKPDIDINIKKVDDKNNAIGDAVFELYKSNGETFEKVTNSTYSWLDSNNQFTVGTDGFQMKGLSDGTYQIKEVKSPAGYVITDETPVTFTVTGGYIVNANNILKGGAVYTAAEGSNKDTFTIPNTPGAELPHTGGIGTTIFYILGTALVAVTGIMLWRRRKAL